ncbi:hypothetical protein ID866_5528 [Astraeus odoratus]|nr:hypothetical protein ID866_5528 [Astraeus odoratus]
MLILFVSLPSSHCKSPDASHSQVTSSVTYCSEPDALLIQQFEVTYFQKNSSVWFNISAASVQPNVNVSANIMLNVYGMHPVNFTIDLCSLFNGALCPLPTYNFSGSDTIPLPSSLGVDQMIPDIAFKIPDLEAYAQLTLTEVGTGVLKACVQATLSNGWSAHQRAVEWTTAGMGLFALCSAVWFSISQESLIPFRFLDLLYLYQWAASTALLDLNYSSVYLAFATNFAWSMGLLSASANSPIQIAINNMRHLTGGTMADASGGSAVALVNRKLSPYNAYTISTPVGSQLLEIGQKNSLNANTSAVLGMKQLDTAGAVQLVTSSSSNVLQAGIPIYVNYLGIATANAFMTIFLVALVVFSILLAVLIIGYGILVFASSRNCSKSYNLVKLRQQYMVVAQAWLQRAVLLASAPVTIFAMYQWTLKDSWLSTLFAVVSFLVVVGYLLYCAFAMVRFALYKKLPSPDSQPHYLISIGPLIALHCPTRYYLCLLVITTTFIKAALTAFAHDNGVVQIVIILVVEASLLAMLLTFRPYKTRGTQILQTYLASTRVLCTGLLVAFIEPIGLGAIARVVIGIVVAVFVSIAVVVVFASILLSLWTSHFSRGNSLPLSDTSSLEKGNPVTEAGPSGHPMPEQTISRNSAFNQSYPENSSPMSIEEHSTYTTGLKATSILPALPSLDSSPREAIPCTVPCDHHLTRD